ncbi:c-type cytochrome [Pendulispora brunnea]|uniref:C-type cytochrome n=1 Tax=Pendulispora brunnea TaxID=2905690 RepID=A0ABZ2KDJ2_9BACT
MNRRMVILACLVAWLALACLAIACRDRESKAIVSTGGVPAAGKKALFERGCGACHTIPGVPGANALVGPPLDHMASRVYVAGMLTNTPEHLRTFITHPQRVKPGSAMPEVPLSETEARDVVAYLYTLE